VPENGQDRRLSALMIATQGGDKAAYAQLLRELDAVLTPYFNRRLRCVDTTCDVVQDTLMSMHTARHTYDSEKPFLPWIFAIARCRLVDHWRKQERHAGNEPLEDVDSPDTPELSAQESGAVASEALSELPPNDRDVIQLLKIEGLSLKEVAKKLQITETAVKVRAHRAYQRLREAFHRISNEER
jgi:RNA polymerase sigma-70 factor (ECF subfamily)